MFWKQFYLFAALAALAAAARPSSNYGGEWPSSNTPGAWPTGNIGGSWPTGNNDGAWPSGNNGQSNNNFRDVIQGQLTRNSVLIHSAPFNGVDYEWRGSNLISRLEILDRSGNGSLFNLNIRGGLQNDFVQIWSDSGAVNAVVRIFSAPNNESFGLRTAESVLLNTTRVTGRAPLDVNYAGPFVVRSVELDDRTNGTGATVSVLGLDRSSITARIRSRLFRGQIDYIVRVYGEPTKPNHHELGNLTASSVLINSQIIRNANLTWWGMFQVRVDNNTFDYARLTDLSNGTGGRVISAYHYNQVLEIKFERAESLTFLLQVYGSPRNSSDIIVGEMLPGSVLLAQETVFVWGRRANALLHTEQPIDRIEVINRERSSAVRAKLVAGEVGGRIVAVVFDTDSEFQLINFDVRAFGRPQRNGGAQSWRARM